MSDPELRFPIVLVFFVKKCRSVNITLSLLSRRIGLTQTVAVTHYTCEGIKPMCSLLDHYLRLIYRDIQCNLWRIKSIRNWRKRRAIIEALWDPVTKSWILQSIIFLRLCYFAINLKQCRMIIFSSEVCEKLLLKHV